MPEFLRPNGHKFTVEGDKLKTEYRNEFSRLPIGFNHLTSGMVVGGKLSSFGEAFSNESIGIQSGIGDIVNTKIGDIDEAYDLLGTKMENVDSKNLLGVSQAVLETVDEYFGGFQNTDNRMNYYSETTHSGSANNKISNLKGAGAAMCAERAALSQNLLKSLGINSFYKSSGIIKNGNDEIHSYNLIEFDDKYYIFDAAIPNQIDGQANPLIAEIDKETFDSMTYPLADFGVSATVTHYNPYRGENVCVTYDSGREDQVEACACIGTNE